MTKLNHLPIKKRGYTVTTHKSDLATIHSHISKKPLKKRSVALIKQARVIHYLKTVIEQLEAEKRMRQLQDMEIDLLNLKIYFNQFPPILGQKKSVKSI